MTQELSTQQRSMDAIIEDVVVGGNLAALKPKDRLAYYDAVCRSAGLNPLTRPFEYITLNGKLVLYATKACAEQLRSLRRVSITKIEAVMIDTLYAVTAYASMPQPSVEGVRTDSALGVVDLEGLKGQDKANACMKAETKAKRRVTLSICGLGLMDESEVGDTPGARPALVDPGTGEITEAPEAEQRAALLADAERLAKALLLSPKEKLDLWRKHAGERNDGDAVDIAALADLVAEMQARAEKGGKA